LPEQSADKQVGVNNRNEFMRQQPALASGMPLQS
jgi:hypothetical protein